MQLYPHQKRSATTLAKALVRYGAALDASDTGTGKTYTAAALVAAATRPFAVICPKSVIPVWKKVLAGFNVQPLFVANYEMLRTGRTPWGTWGKRGKFEWSRQIPDNAIFIWDEVHRAKNGQAQNGKMLRDASRFLNLMLSATAAENPLDFRVIGPLLGLFEKSDFLWWALDHGCVRHPLSLSQKPGVLDAALHRIHLDIFGGENPRGVRVRTHEIQGFPENHVVTQPWDFGDDGEIKKLYAQMENEIAELDRKRGLVEEPPRDRSETFAVESEESKLTLQLRARQEVELLKIPLIAERALELFDEGKSVVIFTNFVASLTSLVPKLSVDPNLAGRIGAIYGGQKAEDRQRVIDDFQANRLRAVVVNIAAGGAGISLHDIHGTHPRVSIICPTFSAPDLLQALGRIHRAGGTRATQYIAYAEGTVEEQVVQRALEKISQIGLLNDGAGCNIPKVTPSMTITDLTISEQSPALAATVEDGAAVRSEAGLFDGGSGASRDAEGRADGQVGSEGIAARARLEPLNPNERNGHTTFPFGMGAIKSGVEQVVARLAHNQEAGGSSPPPATLSKCCRAPMFVEGSSGEVTHWHTCSDCGLPCDPEDQPGGVGASPTEFTGSRGVKEQLPVTPGVGEKPVALSQPAHAKHGPSGLEMKEMCPQFVNHDEENPVQQRGTALHKAEETGDDSEIVDLEERAML